MFEEEKTNSNQVPSGQLPASASVPDQPAMPQTQPPSEPEPSPAPAAPSEPLFSEPLSVSPEAPDVTVSELAAAAPMPAAKTSIPRFDAPELAKKEIIEEANEAGGSPEEEMHVMSEKFRKAKARMPAEPGKGGKKVNFLLIGIVVLVVVIAVGGFYLWNKGYLQKYFQKAQLMVQPVSEEQKQPEETTEVEEPVEENLLSLEMTLKKELKNGSDVIVSWAEFHLPEGAIAVDTEMELEGSLLAEQDSKYEKDYKVIGGIYNFSAKKVSNEESEANEESEEKVELILNQPCSFKIFYHQDLVEETWEENLTLGYFKDDIWTPFSSSLDEEKNELTIASLEYLPSNTWAIIIEKTKIVPKVEAFQIAPNTPSSADTDKDGLTDVEESVYMTETNNPDSDADGNPDGQEVIILADPTKTNESKLAASSLINVYTNPTYSYSFFYPGSWLARAIPETGNQEVLVITNTGEFFSATVENNPEKLSPKDWYLRQSPRTDESSLYSALINNLEAVWNPEHLTIYIANDDKVYILSYNVGTEEEANFKTTFEMLINSFQFVTQTQGRSDGTLIKYSDQPGVYLIQAGKKRAFASGEIFEKLGFKWEDVIEITVEEIYSDGPIIDSNVTTSQIQE